jgi:hypothetical protein
MLIQVLCIEVDSTVTCHTAAGHMDMPSMHMHTCAYIFCCYLRLSCVLTCCRLGLGQLHYQHQLLTARAGWVLARHP